MGRIHAHLEGIHANAAECLDESLAVFALGAINLDDSFYGGSHFVLRNRRADHLTERRRAVYRAAKRDLVPLLTVLIDTENADVPDVVMAACIHATRHLDLDVTKIVEIVQIVELHLDLVGDLERAGVGETAEIQPRARNHVREGADVGRGESEAAQL